MRRLGALLRRVADRIDYQGAPRYMSSHSFTFELGRGIVFREDGKGCPLAYMSQEDYLRAHEESDSGGTMSFGTLVGAMYLRKRSR